MDGSAPRTELQELQVKAQQVTDEVYQMICQITILSCNLLL